MDRFHRESVLGKHAVIRHFITGRVSVEYCHSREAANDVANRAMDLPDCLYAYTSSLDNRFSNLPAIATMNQPHKILNKELG